MDRIRMPMIAANKAVFLSYASQDAEAARRICEALRAAGVEVWFDQSELRGGDAWDAKIRKQIKECALFVPVISANTQARPEGYFRLEWHLAEQRSHLIARGRPFIVPVAVDATNDADALVPDAFLAVQWMRVPGGETTPAFCERVKILLGGGDVGRDRLIPPSQSEQRGKQGGISDPALQIPRRPRWLKPVLASAMLVVVAVAVTLWQRSHKAAAEKPPAASPPVAATVEKLSPARELVDRARIMLSKGSLTRAQLDAANELLERALQLDPTDAIVWAAAARIDLALIYPYGYDLSAERRKRAQERATRAINLAPDEFEVRVIHAAVLAHAVGTPALIAEAEKTFRELVASRPGDQQLVQDLAEVLREARRFDEAAKLFASVGEFEVAGWSYFQSGESRAALAAVSRAPRSSTALQLTAILEYSGNGDLAAAQAAIDRLQPAELLAEMPATVAMRIAMYRRDPERMLELARGLARDYIDANGFRGPRGYFTGLAHQTAGRPAQAEAEWRAALAVVESMQKSAPDDRQLLLSSAWLRAALKDTAAAEAIFARSQALAGLDGDSLDLANYPVLLALRKKEALLAGAEQYFRGKQPLWQTIYAELRFSPEADFLRGDPRFEKLLRDHLPPGAKPFAEPKPAAVPVNDKSVAVLAFANLSDDKGNEYFSDGISEELLNVLAKVPGLKVSARTSAFFFKGKEVPVPEIAKQLGVAYVVEGSVRKQGDKVRITAQLIKAADGFHVWSDTFTRDLKDIFAVQDEIAGLIAKNLAATLGAVTRSEAVVDARAFELYMQSRAAWNRRNAEGFDRAEILLRQALEIAPDFARAHAALADVWMIRAISDGKLSRYGQRSSSVIPPIEAEAQRALELDPKSAEAHATLGFLRQLQHRPEEALRLLRRSVELNPNYATGHHWLAGVLAAQSWFDESIAEARRSVAVDPLSPRILDNFGWTLAILGRLPEALALFDRALTLLPDEPQALAHRAITLARLGRRNEARALAGRVTGNFRLMVLSATGDRAEIEAALPTAGRLDRFLLLSALGRYDEALTELHPDDVTLEDTQEWFFDSHLISLKNDPRFRQVIAELGFDDVLARALAWQAAHPPEKVEAKK